MSQPECRPIDAPAIERAFAAQRFRILYGAGMLERTKIAKQVRYAISDPSAFELCAGVGGEMRRELQQLEALLGERDQVRAWAREPTLSR